MPRGSVVEKATAGSPNRCAMEVTAAIFETPVSADVPDILSGNNQALPLLKQAAPLDTQVLRGSGAYAFGTR